MGEAGWRRVGGGERGRGRVRGARAEGRASTKASYIFTVGIIVGIVSIIAEAVVLRRNTKIWKRQGRINNLTGTSDSACMHIMTEQHMHNDERCLRVVSIASADVRRPWISSDLGEGVQPPTPQTPQPLQPLPVEIRAGISNNVSSSSSTKFRRISTSLKRKK